MADEAGLCLSPPLPSTSRVQQRQVPEPLGRPHARGKRDAGQGWCAGAPEVAPWLPPQGEEGFLHIFSLYRITGPGMAAQTPITACRLRTKTAFPTVYHCPQLGTGQAQAPLQPPVPTSFQILRPLSEQALFPRASAPAPPPHCPLELPYSKTGSLPLCCHCAWPHSPYWAALSEPIPYVCV